MSTKIPVLRGFIASNVIRCFAEEGGDAEAVCKAVGLPAPSSIEPSQTLPSERYYSMLNLMTEKLADPYFPFRIGQTQARDGITALAEARRRSRTLGDFLAEVRIAYREATSHVRYELHDDGARAVVRVRRSFTPTVSVANLEAMHAGGFVTTVLDAVGWDNAAHVTISVPDTSKIPADLLPKALVLSSGNEPMSLSFPSGWLLEELKTNWELEFEDAYPEGDHRLTQINIRILKTIVAERISDAEFDLETLARELGVSIRRLQRYLASLNTNFRSVARDARLSRARNLLKVERDKTITEIALECGYGTAQSLSRAFHARYGESPTKFRSGRE